MHETGVPQLQVLSSKLRFSDSGEKCEFKNHTNEPTKLLKTKECNFYTNQMPEITEVIPLTNQITENRWLTTNGHAKFRVRSSNIRGFGAAAPMEIHEGVSVSRAYDRECKFKNTTNEPVILLKTNKARFCVLAEPVRSLKTGHLSGVSRHVADGQWVI